MLPTHSLIGPILLNNNGLRGNYPAVVEEVGYLDPLLKPAELINTLNKNINVFLLVELNDLRFFYAHKN